MVFGLDDEPIPGVDAWSSSSDARQLLLNPLAHAAPTNENVRIEALSEATLLAESFKESTNVLAQALMWGKSPISPAANAMSSVAPSTPLVASTQEHTSASGPWALDQKIKNIEVHLNEVQSGMGVRLTEVQSNFNARQGEVMGMLDRVLAAIGAVKAGGAGGVVGVGGVGGVGEASRSPENGGS